MAVLTKEQIIELEDRPIELVPVPEWGDDAQVAMRGMSAFDRNKLEGLCMGDGGESDKYALMTYVLVFSLCDEAGVRTWADDEAPLLLDKCGAAFHTLAMKAIDINGMAGAQQLEVVKNSDAVLSGDFSSDSASS